MQWKLIQMLSFPEHMHESSARNQEEKTYQEINKTKTSLLFHCWANEKECIYMHLLEVKTNLLFKYTRM